VIAKDLMSEVVLTVSEDATIGEVAEIFQEKSIRHLPVVDGTELVGIVSDRDIRNLFVPRLIDEEGLDSIKARYGQPISTLMATDVIKVNEDAELADVVELMLEYKVGAVPVVEESTGDLKGIISYIDVLRTTVD